MRRAAPEQPDATCSHSERLPAETLPVKQVSGLHQQPRPVIFGEVLFDIFPGGKRTLGGASFNVASHLAGFECAPIFVSAVGDDDYGREILNYMHDRKMDTSCMQMDPDHPTGTVSVSLAQGEPSYVIEQDTAYDFIHANAIEAVKAAGAVALLYHGTLALRNPCSRETFDKLLTVLQVPTYCDLNLRSPHWHPELIRTLLSHTAWLKLNIDELDEVHALGMLNTFPSDEGACFQSLPTLAGIMLTRGQEGADLHLPAGIHHHAGVHPARHLKNPVGAGDALSAIVLLGLLRNWPMDTALNRGAVFASAVCELPGAVPENLSFYDTFKTRWADEDRHTAKDH